MDGWMGGDSLHGWMDGWIQCIEPPLACLHDLRNPLAAVTEVKDFEKGLHPQTKQMNRSPPSKAVRADGDAEPPRRWQGVGGRGRREGDSSPRGWEAWQPWRGGRCLDPVTCSSQACAMAAANIGRGGGRCLQPLLQLGEDIVHL